MRNALGKDEGGSGVPIDHEAYMEAYKFWDKREFNVMLLFHVS
jgi:hypothetical protein